MSGSNRSAVNGILFSDGKNFTSLSRLCQYVRAGLASKSLFGDNLPRKPDPASSAISLYENDRRLVNGGFSLCKHPNSATLIP